MYVIKINGRILHSADSDTRFVLEPKLHVDCSGKRLSFRLPPSHPEHLSGELKPLRLTHIEAFRGTELLFSGRIQSITTGYDLVKDIVCEDWSCMLNDVIVAPYSHYCALPLYFDLMNDALEQFYSGLDSGTQLSIELDPAGITVTEDHAFTSADYVPLKQLIDAACKDYEIELKRAEVLSSSSVHLIYCKSIQGSQGLIEHGRNLLDLTVHEDGTQIATRIYALGAADVNGERLTLTETFGSPYVDDTERMHIYGVVAEVHTWDEVTDASELKAKAAERLQVIKERDKQIEVKALDPRLIGLTAGLKVGSKAAIKSEPHGIDTKLTVHELELDMLRPEGSEATLGSKKIGITDIDRQEERWQT